MAEDAIRLVVEGCAAWRAHSVPPTEIAKRISGSAHLVCIARVYKSDKSIADVANRLGCNMPCAIEELSAGGANLGPCFEMLALTVSPDAHIHQGPRTG